MGGIVNGVNWAETWQTSLVSDATADQLLRNQSMVDFLTRKGGLKLTKGMTQEQKRAAIRQAVNQIVGKRKEAALPKDGIHDNIETADGSFAIGVGVGAKAKNYKELVSLM